MTGRELSENLNYLGMSSGIRKLALKEKLETAEKLAVMNEVEVCDLVAMNMNLYMQRMKKSDLSAKIRWTSITSWLRLSADKEGEWKNIQ